MLDDVQFDSPLARVGSSTALFDVRYNKDINVLVGCALGGTSIINAGIGIRPASDVTATDAWPVELHAEGVLDSFFVHAEGMLKPLSAPPSFQKAGKAAGAGSSRQTIGQDCNSSPAARQF